MVPNLRDGDFHFEKVLSHLSFCWIFIECFLWPSNKRQGINFLALRQKRKGKNPLGAASREKRNVHSSIDYGVHILQKRSEKKNLSLSKEKSQKAHLSKCTSGRNYKSRQLPRIHFLRTVFHALYGIPCVDTFSSTWFLSPLALSSFISCLKSII